MANNPVDVFSISSKACDRQAWFDAGLLYALYVGVNVAGNMAYRFLSGHPWLAVAQSVGILLFLLVVVLMRRGYGHPDFAVGGLGDALHRFRWLWVFALLIALVAARFQGLFQNHSFLWYLWLFAGVVLAPITEEFAFRGAIQTSLNRTSIGSKTFIGFRLGTLISAILFSCAHFALLAGNVAMPRVLFEVLSALPLALFAGYVYQRTTNIWYGVLVHALGNLGGA